jgi:hypothetical protein
MKRSLLVVEQRDREKGQCARSSIAVTSQSPDTRRHNRFIRKAGGAKEKQREQAHERMLF